MKKRRRKDRRQRTAIRMAAGVILLLMFGLLTVNTEIVDAEQKIEKEEPDKEESGKEEPDEKEPDKEEAGKEEPDKEETNKEESGKEEPDKENPDKEEPDKTPPEQVSFLYDLPNTDAPIYTNEAVKVTMKSKDDTSGVAAMIYRAGGETEKRIEGAEGTVLLEPEFAGTVEAYAVDKAGNKSERSVSQEMIIENTAPEVFLSTNGSGEGWNNGPVRMWAEVTDSGLSAGIQSVKCYVNHELIIHEQPEHTEGVITAWETAFTVEQNSINGAGIPVVVEATDRAGNFQTVSRLLYIDGNQPQIELKGAADGEITGSPSDMEVLLEDDNILETAGMQVWRTSPKGERMLYAEQVYNQPETGGGTENHKEAAAKWQTSLTEDGYYEISVNATDRAGNVSELRKSLTVDRTNPVIRYVEQMQGQYVPYFQWNYDVGEMIWDFTKYDYQMTLNGEFYVSGKHVTSEGVHLLRVTATDSAGNEAAAEAMFYIDHTPPEIQIFEVENGKEYETEVTLEASVGGKGEVLEEILINSEALSIEENSRIFRQTFREAGAYKVKIRAGDLTGNTAEKEVSFTLKEKKGLAALLKPITDRTDKEEQRSAEAKEAERTKNILWLPFVYLLLFVVLSAVGAGITAFGYMERKRSLKRPDAEQKN